MEIEIERESGPAETTAGHTLKYWGGTADYSGIAVESMVSIKLTCQQNQVAIEAANKAASALAYELMHDNSEKLRRDLIDFLDHQKDGR